MSTEAVTAPTPPPHNPVTAHKHGGLKELAATAICGNDITSSCLYVSALAILAAGKWAPVALLLVAGVLFLFRPIYGEVVGALPLNGGAYNALLNTTSKRLASMAATLTLLSYMATAVISSLEAMHYVESLAHGSAIVEGLGEHTFVMGGTVLILLVFMILTIVGISESAVVAIGIFVFHMASLTLLAVLGGVYLLLNGFDTLRANMAAPLPEETNGLVILALFFGFSAAMLGISGFESSSNFVEEQAEGVFPKTLRNMWIAVSIFNPLMAFLALAILPLGEVGQHSEALLAHLGDTSGGSTFGPWLKTLISIDAALVLNGAVLTSFIGVTGLVRRMTLDRCLPQFLLKKNRRGTSHRIIIFFFLLGVSVLFITDGELVALAGVYTLSFLSVMILFALGNVLLKIRRTRLPRPERARWSYVVVAIVAVAIGLLGNAIRNPEYLIVFLAYFFPAAIIILLMLGRIGLLRGLLFVVRSISESIGDMTAWASLRIRKAIRRINSQQMVYFTRGDNARMLNRVVLYVRGNEQTNRVKVVNVFPPGGAPPQQLIDDLEFIDKIYPEIDLEFVGMEGEFGPDLIHELSEEWDIPVNFMFIGSPGDHFLYGVAELGGVRLIV